MTNVRKNKSTSHLSRMICFNCPLIRKHSATREVVYSFVWNLILRKSKSTLIHHSFPLQIHSIHDDRLIIRKSKKFLSFACQTSFRIDIIPIFSTSFYTSRPKYFDFGECADILSKNRIIVFINTFNCNHAALFISI